MDYSNKIEAALSNLYPEIVCLKARKDRQDEYEFALFFHEHNADIYKEGYDSEDIIIWKTDKGEWGFSYNVHDPGVRYHADGSGTPPSDELVEHKEVYPTLLRCVEGVAQHLINMKVNEMQEHAMTIFHYFED